MFKGVWRPFPIKFGDVAVNGPLFLGLRKLSLVPKMESQFLDYIRTQGLVCSDFSVFLQKFTKGDDETTLIPTNVVGIAHFN